MGRKKKHTLPFDREGGFSTIQHRLLRSDAYLGLSAQAKALMHLMQVYWRNDEPVGYGVAEAQQKIPCCKKIASRAFKELESHGFIEMQDDFIFSSRVSMRTKTWRLTWLPYKSQKPTNDWKNWRPP